MGSNIYNLTKPKLVLNSSLIHWLVGINRLLESVSLCLEVIPLIGAYCNSNLSIFKSLSNIHDQIFPELFHEQTMNNFYSFFIINNTFKSNFLTQD
jgi:hypothetical protein